MLATLPHLIIQIVDIGEPVKDAGNFGSTLLREQSSFSFFVQKTTFDNNHFDIIHNKLLENLPYWSVQSSPDERIKVQSQEKLIAQGILI